MSALWFDPTWSWIPGTALGVMGGLLGSLAGVLAPRGKARSLVLGLLGVLLAASLASLVLGVVALLSGQPYAVWYALLLPGIIGLSVLVPLAPLLLMRYRQADERKMQSQDL